MLVSTKLWPRKNQNAKLELNGGRSSNRLVNLSKDKGKQDGLKSNKKETKVVMQDSFRMSLLVQSISEQLKTKLKL